MPAFHAGEIALQARLGMDERLAEVGTRVIRDRMPGQHQQFFAQLPWLLVGSLDAQGHPRAGVLSGPSGFMHAPDDRTLRVDALPAVHDPLATALRPGASLGLLGIELPTRRRNRLNGVVSAVDARGFSVAVQQSFGNCPRYIQARETAHVQAQVGAASEWSTEVLPWLDAEARQLVARADTFFIASAHPAAAGMAGTHEGVDISHRGGPPGFVRWLNDAMLAVPDYDGNRYFNTLGNLALNPAAALLFIDFERGDILHLQVHASVEWGPVPAGDAPHGPPAERWLRLLVLRGERRRAALPLRWGEVAWSREIVDATRDEGAVPEAS